MAEGGGERLQEGAPRGGGAAGKGLGKGGLQLCPGIAAAAARPLLLLLLRRRRRRRRRRRGRLLGQPRLGADRHGARSGRAARRTTLGALALREGGGGGERGWGGERERERDKERGEDRFSVV